MDYFLPLIENNFYHIYNRGNNKENIFFSTENYHYFLRKYDEYLSDYLETYAYCLLPNHFHLLVRVKECASDRRSTFLKSGTSTLTDSSKIISELFRRFFTSYSKSINKQQSRTGSLFQKNFKRKHIETEAHLTAAIKYIHANPQNHGICEDFRYYEHSSYGRIMLEKPTKLMKTEVLEWFGGKEAYMNSHGIKLDKDIRNKIEIED
jgi:REP element-mobilizing transposase RayT